MLNAKPAFTVGLAFGQPMLEAAAKLVLQNRPDIRIVDLDSVTEATLNATGVQVLLIDDQFDHFFEEPFPEDRQEVLKNCPTVLLAAREKDWIWRVHKSGVTGMLTPASRPEEIIEALYSSWKGGRYFSQPVVDILVEMSFRANNVAGEKLHEHLSEREMEIFLMVANGKSSKEIAEALFLSPHTVNTHRKNILRKLSCKNAAELLSYAYHQGLIESPRT